MRNYETMNYDVQHTDETRHSNGTNHSCGTILCQSSISEIIASKNGIELRQVTVTKKIHFELYMDGELLNKFYNLKTAKAMWKDFSA